MTRALPASGWTALPPRPFAARPPFSRKQPIPFGAAATKKEEKPQGFLSLARLPWLMGKSTSRVVASAEEAPPPPPQPPTPQRSTKTTNGSTATKAADERPVLSVAGGGRYFFWYLGVLKYLSEFYDLSKCTLVGASAGGLVVVLAACNVNLDRAVREAFRLSLENDIWNRPAGLAGIWGGLVREWLDNLLPEDADLICQGKVKLVVTEALTLRIRYIEDFDDREDLINALMSSIHIPFFLDGNATSTFRSTRYIDGSLWEFFGFTPEHLDTSGNACVIDYFFDETLEFDRLDFVKLSSYEEVKALVKKGVAYAERRDASGGFDDSLGTARKSALRLALEFPARQLNKVFAEA